MNIIVLWADDEIELVKPHLIFYKIKDDVIPVVSGERCFRNVRIDIDIILLDENMPGLSGMKHKAYQSYQ